MFFIAHKGHNKIIVGNLKIIDDIKLQKPFSIGPKYRKYKTTDYRKAKESIITGTKSCIQCWCNKDLVNASVFSE